MSRSIQFLGIAVAALWIASPALAADTGDGWDGLRGTMPGDWGAAVQPDPLEFEAGLRYWYSMGSQSFAVGASSLDADDTSHILEGHLRIDDHSTSSYVKALAGLAVAINGSYTTSNTTLPLDAGSIVDGQVGYAGADFGMNVLGDPQTGGAGWLVGYHYWNDSPDTSRQNFTTAETVADVSWSTANDNWTVGGDSEPNDIDIHAMRLGVSGKADLGLFDISAEVAAVPFAWVNGTLGSAGFATTVVGTTTTMQSSPVGVNGYGYGAMAELMAGFHPTDNMTIRLGARAWYLQGTVDSTYSTVSVTDPVDSDGDGLFEEPGFSTQDWISTSDPFSLFRYGALLELTYSF